MHTVKEVVNMMREFAPEEFSFKEEYDNVGFLVGREDSEVSKVMCCLDITKAVIDEAISRQVKLIISHHPLIFYPIKSITADTVLGDKLIRLIENKINVYAAHTNLDYCKDGINDYVATLLGLHNIQPIKSDSSGVCFGRVGDLSNKISLESLQSMVATLLKDNHTRIVGHSGTFVKKIAVINGGGGGDTTYIDWAKNVGADCLITADVKHHVAIYAQDKGIALIEPQHYNMEHIYIARLIQELKMAARQKNITIEILQAQSEQNPRL